MKVTLIHHTQDAARLLVFTKRTRLNMTAGAYEDTAKLSQDEILAELAYMANTIPSSWEMVDYVFMVEGVSRAYTHQQVRTRAASYAQQSMRVVNMSDFDYVYSDRVLHDPQAKGAVDLVLSYIKEAYAHMVRDLKIPAEDARGILPTNIATNIVCKFNLRTMAELARSRTGGRTQQEYQRVVRAMIDEVLRVHPWADKFFAPKGRDYFAEIEAFAEREYGGDLLKKGELLKIVDALRKAA